MNLWIKVAVSIGVLAVLAFVLPWSEVVESAEALPASVWLIVLLGFLIGHLVGASKWTLVLRGFGAPLPWRGGTRYYAAGLFANLCLPGIVGGDVIKATLATKRTHRAEAVILGSVADRVIDTVALMAILGAGSMIAGARVADATLRLALILVIAGLVAGGLVGMLMLRRPLRSWPPRLRRIIARVLVAFRHLRRRPAVPIIAFLLALSMQSFFVLLNAHIGDALAIEVPTSVWFVVWPLAKLAGLLPVSLGGLGVRDATQGALLTGFGVPAARGVVASLVWQSVLIAGGLLAGLYWWLGSRRNGQSLLEQRDV